LKILPYLKNPLVLLGVCLFLFVGILKVLLKAKIISPLTQRQSAVVLRMFLKYGFWLAIVSMVCGVGYAGYEAQRETIRPAGTVNQQTGSCGANVNGDRNNTSVDCKEKPAGAK
jgi:hypothetical protein